MWHVALGHTAMSKGWQSASRVIQAIIRIRHKHQAATFASPVAIQTPSCPLYANCANPGSFSQAKASNCKALIIIEQIVQIVHNNVNVF